MQEIPVKVFIAGSSGTTGLRIQERLAKRTDLQVCVLPEDLRKNPAAIAEALNNSDIAFLCLPDEASRAVCQMVRSPHTVILDTSTAHRTEAGWVYGFPELSAEQTALITKAKRIAVPGCHASGFIALVRPLVEAGLLAPATPLTCISLTGYSGGGKKMIAQYEAQDRDPLLQAPRQYALTQQHKHLPEMTLLTGLSRPPLFCPIVADFYSGMEVTVPLDATCLVAGKTIEDIRTIYKKLYHSPLVCYIDNVAENGFLSALAYADKDSMSISVLGNSERILLVARYDNLGKGASGAAIECMNLVLGLDPTFSLNL